MIKRDYYSACLATAAKRSPVTALLGPRQCGKTTLARIFGRQHKSHYFDLESPADQQRLQNPELILNSLQGLIILDEIQIMPGLFNILRVLVDRPENRQHFLVLGSASPHIIRNVSETLAGRVEFIELAGFNIQEINNIEQLWLRGGFPRSFLAASESDSRAWRDGFIRTFLERDIPMLGITIASAAMRRFWTMLAHFHGQTWNASDLARSMGLSDKTVRSYLDILTATFMVRQLQPWHENLRKRQVKSPKIYFRDSGLLHSLLNIPDYHSLTGNPRLGASWEGFALEQVLQIIHPAEAYFWATHSGAELDLLFFRKGKRYGVEFKFNEAPGITKSMHIAVKDLSLDYLWVVYPGKEEYPVTDKIMVRPLNKIRCGDIDNKPGLIPK
ncbi:ATP-binding protein [Desulfobacula sp.]|uniref:ATP-binding protein n=1 Tax=Desulfobacula sp. TaxID=2593537 RepID=UPI0025BAD9AC|nr:ATP-binding protein [Desulfobacula sp.]MBC2705968.1 ATP-binding protein [Desulfobacula sp.]